MMPSGCPQDPIAKDPVIDLSESIQVRDAREDELAAVRELTLRAYAEYASVMTPSAWAALRQAVVTALDTGQQVERIVAEQGGALVGSVMLYPASADAYEGGVGRVSAPEVRLLAVAPEARGRGVGLALVEECVLRAQAAGATELGLHTSRSMKAAIRMYRRLGFERVPERDFRPSGAEIVEAYRLVLGSPE